jgi:DNA segregation ATPase FtsK/SpoIIIE, S-DNA-T family
MGRRRKRKPFGIKIKPETVQSITAVVLFMLGILVVISFSGQGAFLQALNTYLVDRIGLGVLFLPFVFIASGLVMLRIDWAWSKPNVLLGTLLLMGGTMGVTKAGAIGDSFFANLAELISPIGSYVVFGTMLLIGVLIISQFSLHELIQMISGYMERRAERAADKAAANEASGLFNQDELATGNGFSIPKLGFPFGKSSNKSAEAGFKVNDNTATIAADEAGTAVLDAAGNVIAGAAAAGAGSSANAASSAAQSNSGAKPDSNAAMPNSGDANTLTSDTSTHNTVPIVWEYPPLTLLSNKGGGEADRGDVKSNAAIIEQTLDSFGIRAKVVEVNYGPSVTQYGLEITRGTKLSKITGLATDLALALAAPTGQIRIEAPIAGRSLVGIEVPNMSAQYVTLRQMLSSPTMKSMKSKLAVALGIGVSGKPIITDISKMPHMLIAGATGSGKSVAINTFLCSILFRASPSEVKLILVDPKRVELTGYNDVPHLLTPVIVEPSKVVSALKWATVEMENRYKKLAEVGVKNIDGYNELAGFAAMPAILIVIDEIADVMMFAPGDVEECITRLAQMARAVGIHLVLATQRPSVDVITGLIKANIPSRVAFQVSSMSDSRVILDMPGAEKLLGKGDMLFIPPDQAKPSRIQGTFVSDAEAKALVDFIKAQGAKPEYEEDITTKYSSNTLKGGSSGSIGADGEDRDDYFDEAVKLISQHDKASSSLIQRRLSVGYARAARILDQLEQAGLVSQQDGSKPRDVNVEKLREYLSGASNS